MSKTLEDSYAKEIGIPKSHKLVLKDKKIRRNGGRDDEDFYFDEVNEKNEVVAQYHAWSYQDTSPPLKSKNGITKVS